MATVANQIPTQNIGGMTYYQGPDGKWYDGKGVPAPGQDDYVDDSGSASYEQGVTATDPISGYVSNYNPKQYATPETTQRLGADLGLPTGETRMEFSDASQPQRTVGGLNAGLMQDTINRYGPPTPGSMSEYLIQRDLASAGGEDTGTGDFANYSNYYGSAPVQAAKAAAAKAAPKAGIPPGAPAGDYTGSIGGPATPGGSPGFGAPPGATPLTPRTGNPVPYGRGPWNTTQPPAAPPPAGTAPPPGSAPPPPAGTAPPPAPGPVAPPGTAPRAPYVPPVSGPPIPGGSTGGSRPPTGAYQPRANPASFRSNPGNAYPNVQPQYTQRDTPEGENKGEGLQFKTENDRALALQRGEELNADLGNYTDQQYAEAGDFSDLQGEAYSGIAAGEGGRSGDEKNAILREDELNSLQQTEDEANSNYLTGAEEAGIRGDPDAAYAQLGRDEAGIDTAANFRDAATRGEYYAGRNATNTALAGQETGVRGAVGRQRELSNATLVGEANNARKYVDPTALNTSSEYNSQYNFGDRDVQDIVDRAGRTVGAGAQADEDRLLSDANANGNTSPLALQAARNRLRQTGAVGSADAMTDARILAKRLQLETAQGKENTRLGAAQNYADLGVGTELDLGQDAMNMQGELGAAEIGAESYLGDQRVRTQQSLGQQGTALEKDIGQSHIDVGTTGAQMNLAAGQQKDAAASARAGQVATNRQAATGKNQDTRYGRGMDIYGRKSAANQDFSDQRLGAEAEYRKTLGDRQAQAAQNVGVGNQQRIGNYGQQTGAVNAATGNAIVNYKVPSAGEKILGGIAGLVGGAKGLITPGPQVALVGEAGPELEVEIDKLPHYGYGFDPLAQDGQPDYLTGSGETDYEGNALPGGTMSQNRENPFWKKIVNTISPYGYQPFKAEQVDDAPYQSPIGRQKQGGGLLRKMITGGMYAEGGIVDGAHEEEIAPGINYLEKPQVRTLGTNGPTAIVPLIRRPGNKLNPEDIPQLAARYGNYGREPQYAR